MRPYFKVVLVFFYNVVLKGVTLTPNRKLEEVSRLKILKSDDDFVVKELKFRKYLDID